MDIKAAIRNRGLMINEVATRMGITPQAMSQIINGNPTVKKIESLAAAIGCSPADFFCDWQGSTVEPEAPQPDQELKESLSPADELPFGDDKLHKPSRRRPRKCASSASPTTARTAARASASA